MIPFTVMLLGNLQILYSRTWLRQHELLCYFQFAEHSKSVASIEATEAITSVKKNIVKNNG
jgi:hypothetical protein